MQRVALSLAHITKTYPGVVALNDVSIDFFSGEVHALLGENGAGKSTLIKVLSGAIEPDGGSLTVNGKCFQKMNPALSRSQGIEVIYQEFNLFPTLTVGENVFMGSFPGNGFLIDKAQMARRTKVLFDELQVDIDPGARVCDLSVAYQQLVEIVKAVSRDAKILVMDEPTAPLTSAEVQQLFKMVARLKARGVTIIYISHRMSEIFQICDRVTVLRDSRLISSYPIAEASRERMIKDMIGREINESYPKKTCALGEALLSVEHLTGLGVKDVSFEVRRGEIFSLSGLVGAGRTETARMIFGASKPESGRVLLDGREVHPRSPRQGLKAGIALIPEDRKRQGVILNLPIRHNISLSVLPRLSKLTVVNAARENSLTEEQMKSLRIKAPSAMQLVKNLSGGNQQKVVLAKWLISRCSLFIFDEPTRGIDVGAKQEIYSLMHQLCDQGHAILMISSEMDEVIGMSDRIMVLCEGRVSGTLERADFSQERIMTLASGQ